MRTLRLADVPGWSPVWLELRHRFGDRPAGAYREVAEAHQRVPALAILALPILFAAGMTLLDTSDGVFMAYAYGEALRRPSSRFRYNFMTTALSR